MFTILRSFIYAPIDVFCMSPMPRGFPSWSAFPGNLDHPPPPPQSPNDWGTTLQTLYIYVFDAWRRHQIVLQ
jgi:hypothetical protein